MNNNSNVKELTVEADLQNLDPVIDFVDERLDELGCTMKAKMQIGIAIEEIFVNVVKYAFDEGSAGSSEQTGSEEAGRIPEKISIRVEDTEDPRSVAVTIIDRGRPFDPLAKADPDVTLSADSRKVGGLGIFMVKKSMDQMEYEYRDGQNILTFRKDL